jgi:hypothetical protein
MHGHDPVCFGSKHQVADEEDDHEKDINQGLEIEEVGCISDRYNGTC